MVRAAATQDPESVPNVCGGIAANTPTNVGVSFLGQKKGADRPEEGGGQVRRRGNQARRRGRQARRRGTDRPGEGGGQARRRGSAGRLRRTDKEQQEGSGEGVGSTSHTSTSHLHSRNATNHPGLQQGSRLPCRPLRSQAPQARPAPLPNAPLPRSAQWPRAAHRHLEGVRRPPAPLAQIP